LLSRLERRGDRVDATVAQLKAEQVQPNVLEGGDCVGQSRGGSIARLPQIGAQTISLVANSGFVI
jgi:hypothetical protein